VLPVLPTLPEVRAFSQRVRSAGSPRAVARPRLVADYVRMARSLGVEPEPVATGEDLQRATLALLRAAGGATARL
jgi:hypothetical protein